LSPIKLILTIWLYSWIALSAFSSSGIAAERNVTGCIELFYVDPDNNLYYKQQDSPGGIWTGDELISGSVASVFLYRDAEECLLLFYIGLDNKLYYRYQVLPEYDWSEVEEFSVNARFMAAIDDSDERLNVFYITTDNRLIQRYRVFSGVWSGAVELAEYAKTVTAGRNEDGRMEIFYTIADNTLYHQYQLSAGGEWSDGYPFSDPSKQVTVSQNEDGRLEVFFIDNSNVLRHKWQEAVNGSWSDDTVFATYAKLVVATKNHDQRMEIFYTADHDYVYHKWQTAASNGWDTGKQFGWEAYELTAALNQDGRLEVFYIGADDILYHNWQLEPGLFWAGEYPFLDELNPLFSFEDYNAEPVYQPDEPDWHVNDHCFIPDDDNYWHMYGIVAPDPDSDDPTVVNYFGHAGSAVLNHTTWSELSPPFYESLEGGGVVWAPHVIYHNNTYYMFYCAGGSLTSYKICLRISPDLIHWSDPEILFTDGFQARDPMVIWLEEEQLWVMYYCATSNPSGGYHIVAYRASENLYDWSTRNIAYTDFHTGTTYGPTESPFVVVRGDYYYLFIGPRPYDPPSESLPNWEHPGYAGTDVFRSLTWDQWTNADYVGHVDAHATEIIQDLDGNWYSSHCGIDQGGLFIRKMNWLDGINSNDSYTYPIQSVFQLDQNVPNPFSDQTNIRYYLDDRCHVLIEVIDFTGSNVKQLENRMQLPGVHSLLWDGTNAAGERMLQGIYLCRFIAGDRQEIRKILLLKE